MARPRSAPRRLGSLTTVAALAASFVTAAPGVAHAAQWMQPSIGQQAHMVPTASPLGVGAPLPCQNGAPDLPRCYGPAQIRAAYDVQRVLDRGVDGTGMTIVLIEAYDQSSIADDLAAFDAQFDLPAADVSTVAPFGVPGVDFSDPNQIQWSRETALDAE
jgi:subtilase family serine protease